MELDLVASEEAVNKGGEEVLSHLHHILEISVGLIDFDGGKFWIVGSIDLLVSELLSDFVNSVKSSDDQHLQVQFWSDSHEHIQLEIVVVGDEWLSSGPSYNHIHHWSFYFNEISIIEELSDELDDLGSGQEDISGIWIHDKIKISLSVSLFLVMESLVELGEHMEAGRKEFQLDGENRDFSGVGERGGSFESSNISSLDKIKVSHEFFVVLILIEFTENLKLISITSDIEENQKFSLFSDIGNSSCNRDGLILQNISLVSQ